jgi:hypothetical protein
MRCVLRALLTTTTALAMLVGALVAVPTTAAAGVANETMEADFAARINQERTSRGLRPLGVSLTIRGVSRDWSATMNQQKRLYHNPNMAAQIGALDVFWQGIAENVGRGHSVDSLHSALMNSKGHRDNILGNWNYVSVGVVVSGSEIWLTQNFVRTTNTHALVSAPAPAAREAVWLIRHAPAPGTPELSIPYGMTSYQTLSCDWNGNGVETVGVYSDGVFYLRNDNSPGAPHLAIPYGWTGPTAVCGDWNGDGVDTIGLYHAGQWLLRDSNTPGHPDRSFSYGWSAAAPVVGDWNGNGTDGVGVYSSGSWSLRETPTPGAPQRSAQYGYHGAAPVVGDWDGNGTDSIGVFDKGAWSLRQDTNGGQPQVVLSYGWNGTRPVVGDWNGDSRSGVAVIQP